MTVYYRYLAWGKEAAWKTTPGVALSIFTNAYKVSVKANQNINEESTFAGNEVVTKSPGKYEVNGSIDMPCYVDGLGWALTAMYGLPASLQQGATACYEHIFTPKNSVVTYTVDLGRDAYARELISLVVKSFGLKFAAAKDVAASFEFYAVTEQLVAAQVPTFSTYIQSLHWGDVTLTIDGDTYNCRALDLKTEVARDEADLGLGDRFLKGAVKEMFKCTLKMDISFVDDSDLGKFYDGITGAAMGKGPGDTVADFALTLNMTNAVDIGGGEFERLIIECPKAYFKDEGSDVDGKKRIIRNINIGTIKDMTLGYGHRIKLYNRIAAYT